MAEGIELNRLVEDELPSGSQAGDGAFGADAGAVDVVDVAFVSDGCDVLVAGSAGELICVDSVSGAIMWSVPAHLHNLQRAHICASPTTFHVADAVLIDSEGLVRSALRRSNILFQCMTEVVLTGLMTSLSMLALFSQAIRWLGPHRCEHVKVKVPRICSKRLVESFTSSSYDGQLANTASVVAQLAINGQNDLLEVFCSSKGQKVRADS